MLFTALVSDSDTCVHLNSDPQTFQKSKIRPKILGTGSVTCSKFHTKDPKNVGCRCKKFSDLGAGTRSPDIVHPCL